MSAETFGAIASVEAATSGHSSPMVRATAATVVGRVSASTTTRTERERASERMRLAVTSTAKPHQAMSARLGDRGRPITP